MMTDPIDPIQATLDERGSRYGDFSNHAAIAQDLQDVMRGTRNWTSQTNWGTLTPVQRQALTVIADKIARILSGDPNYDDNWIDIQGYARLVQERLPNVSAATASVANKNLAPDRRPAAERLAGVSLTQEAYPTAGEFGISYDAHGDRYAKAPTPGGYQGMDRDED